MRRRHLRAALRLCRRWALSSGANWTAAEEAGARAALAGGSSDLAGGALVIVHEVRRLLVALGGRDRGDRPCDT